MSISQNFQNTYPNLNLNFALEKTLDPRVSFSRASTATYVGSNGLIQTAGVNTPRFTYDPVTGKSLGLLVEESRSNLQTYSQKISNYNTGGTTTITDNVTIAPDGTNTASLAIPTTGTYTHIATNYFNLGSGSFTFSVFAKAAGYPRIGMRVYDGTVYQIRATFDIQNGVIIDNTAGRAIIIPYPNGWYRCICSGTSASGNMGSVAGWDIDIQNSTTLVQQAYAGDGVSGVYLWGEQIETGLFPTSYIPTSGSTVTRSADITQITSTNFSNIYNSNGGGLSVVATPASQTQNRTNVVTIGSGNTNYAASITLLPGANGAQFRSTNSNIAQVDFAAVGSGVTETKVSANFNTGNFIFNTNSNGLGTTSIGIGVTTTATVGTATTITIGGVGIGTTETFNGTIRGLSYYPNTLTTTQVNNLSASNGNVVLGNNQFAYTVRIPTVGTGYTLLTNNSGSYNYNVSWGDGTVTNGITTNNPTHTYTNAGVYNVIVTQNSGSFYFYNNNDSTQGPLVTGVVGNGSSFGWNSSLKYAWYGCSNLTFLSKINSSKVADISYGWFGCSSLTSFPAIDTSNVTTLSNSWYFCSSLTSFPLLNTSIVTNFNSSWRVCSSLTSFPQINTSNGTSFSYAWQNCSSLSSFPQINTSNGTDFSNAWQGCNSLTSFPSITFGGAGATNPIFTNTWQNCSKLSSFPTGAFNSCTGSTNYTSAWTGCGLTSGSIENILTSIVSSGATINTPFPGNIGLNSGTNAAYSTWTTNAQNALSILVGAGWTVSYNTP